MQFRFLQQSKLYGAGEGISGVLLSLFNDNSEESKLLAYQLELLNNYLYTPCRCSILTTDTLLSLELNV